MQLEKLLEGLDYKLLQGREDLEISGVAVDSRKVTRTALFVCIKGAVSDGHRYISQAAAQGAAAILVEEAPEDMEKIQGITLIQTENTRKALAILAANFYGHPAEKLKIIGITGTKGKTTTACMVKTILEKAGFKTGMIGTMGIFYGSVTEKTPNTTPDALTLHRTFKRMAALGCTHVVMETSSQGFKQYRTEGLTFDYGLFLNIDYDHIGEKEHADFEEYLACKMQIFDQSRQIIVNAGSRIWDRLTEEQRQKSVTYRTEGRADYWSTDYKPVRGSSCLGGSFELKGRLWGKVYLSIPGQYNAENALAAIALADQLGIGETMIFEALQGFQAEGRTQMIAGAAKYQRTVLVDYAHNGLSMASMLKALRVYHPRKIVCVFGMRWDETRMRRYDMGAAAGKYADQIVLTEDNAGPEPLESINADIIRGIEDSHGRYTVVPDRREAIVYALDHSGRQDIVVLVGKGHERYQEIDGIRVYFSEAEIVEDHLKSKAKVKAELPPVCRRKKAAGFWTDWAEMGMV